MSASFYNLCSNFTVSIRLHLKLELAMSRETVLHFFDRIRKEYPGLTRLRRRSNGSLLLEEPAETGQSRRWVRLDSTCLRIGQTNPTDLDELHQFTRTVLDQAPAHLTLGDLDYDQLEVIYSFDLEYEGNHDQLVADTLFADHPISGFLMADEATHAVAAEPFWGVALSPACDRQAYLEIKSRTSMYEIRSGQYEAQPLTVVLTTRQYWGIASIGPLNDVFNDLFEQALKLATDRAIPLVVEPLAHAIASRP